MTRMGRTLRGTRSSYNQCVSRTSQKSNLCSACSESSPVTESSARNEGRVPNNVDCGGVEADDNTLETEGDAASRSILDHNNTVAERERLGLEPVDGVGGLKDGLARETLYERFFDLIGSPRDCEHVGDVLDLNDGVLWARRGSVKFKKRLPKSRRPPYRAAQRKAPQAQRTRRPWMRATSSLPGRACQARGGPGEAART